MEFILPLDRLELSSFIGTSKKSLLQTLSEFKNDGLIELEGRKVKILRLDLIEKLNKTG